MKANHNTKKVLFLCTGNSCRSQMAEAIVNQQLGDTWTAFSAGTDPTGTIHPKALDALEEIGILHQGESEPVENYREESFDVVITVCDQAQETCPVWLGEGKVIHCGFKDPAEAQGSEEEITSVFRKVRDQIKEEIPPLLTSIDNQDEDSHE